MLIYSCAKIMEISMHYHTWEKCISSNCSKRCTQTKLTHNWHCRLEEDVSESIDREKGGKDKGKPKLRLKINLPDQVAASIFDPEPLLPKRILQDL